MLEAALTDSANSEAVMAGRFVMPKLTSGRPKPRAASVIVAL